jgi:hypothetical protein
MNSKLPSVLDFNFAEDYFDIWDKINRRKIISHNFFLDNALICTSFNF